MAIDLIIKEGDTRDWTFTLSDTDSTALDLTDARVRFRMKRHEWQTLSYFVRDTGGTGSDNISITDASNGKVSITPTAADYANLSDSFGVFVAEFKISDQNDDLLYPKDILVRIDEVLA